MTLHALRIRLLSRCGRIWYATAAGAQTNLFTLVRATVIVVVILYSSYEEKLTGDAKLRYFHEIKLLNDADLYSLSIASLSTTCLPTKRPDLYNYLVLGTSTYAGTIQGILLVGNAPANGLSIGT